MSIWQFMKMKPDYHYHFRQQITSREYKPVKTHYYYILSHGTGQKIFIHKRASTLYTLGFQTECLICLSVWCCVYAAHIPSSIRGRYIISRSRFIYLRRSSSRRRYWLICAVLLLLLLGLLLLCCYTITHRTSCYQRKQGNTYIERLGYSLTAHIYTFTYNVSKRNKIYESWKLKMYW